MYTHVVFDVDGTLIDTALVCQYSLERLVLSRLGRVLAPHDCDTAFGMTGATVLPAFGLCNDEETVNEWNGYFNEKISEAKVFEGITALLQSLRSRGVRLGLLTSRCAEEMGVDPAIQNILHYFDTVITADLTDEHKPSPAPMREYLRRSGAAAGEVLYIGDTVYDYECARDAGVAFALAGWGALNAAGVPPCPSPQTPAEVLSLVSPDII